MNESAEPAVRIASGDELRVSRFSVQQAMNELFQIEVVALCPNGDVDFDAVIGHPAAFSLATPEGIVRWEGLCSEVRQVRWQARGGLSTYRIVVVPRVWLLTQRRGYRIFQMKSELDIVRQVLAEAGVTVASHVEPALHAPRPYRVQYAESDFAFISRMMEDAGLHYSFETQGDETVMVLDDAPHARATGTEALTFTEDAQPRPARGATDLTVTQRARHAEKQIQLRTNAVDLRPGAVTSILGHAHRAVAGQPLLVVRATLDGDGADVTLAPTDQPYRPEQKTPRPRVQGIERATVVGPEGEAIHTDEHGRVCVHFDWDRASDGAELGSCWVPSSQPWGGAFGSVNLPRIGQEVLVEFLGGDPDRPVVIGRVFNESHPPPYPLPDYKHVTGIRSDPGPRLMTGAADGGTGGDAPAGLFPGGTPYSAPEMSDLATQNGPFKAVSPDAATQGRTGSEISFHDTQGQEIAYFQAQKDANSLIKNAKTSVIGNSRACTIGTDDQLNIENSQQVDIRKNQTVNIGADRTWTIGGDVKQTVTHNYTLLTNDSIVHATDGRIDHYAHGNVLISSDAQITLRVGASFIKLTPDNITIQSGDRVDINPMQGGDEYLAKKKAAADKLAALVQHLADAKVALANANTANSWPGNVSNAADLPAGWSQQQVDKAQADVTNTTQAIKDFKE